MDWFRCEPEWNRQGARVAKEQPLRADLTLSGSEQAGCVDPAAFERWRPWRPGGSNETRPGA